MRAMTYFIVLLCLNTAASCTKTQTFEQSDECRAAVRLPYTAYDVVICGTGESFGSEKKGQWNGDNIKIFKQKGKEKQLLRDFTKTFFGSTYGVTIEAKERLLAITVFSDKFPGWDVGPLFTETIDLDSEAAVITPLVRVPLYDADAVEKLWAEINKNEQDMFPGELPENYHAKFFDRAYGNLFKLRDFAFRNPEAIEEKLKRLGKWDWNDGEVAEVYSQLLSHVSYIKGKQVVLK